MGCESGTGVASQEISGVPHRAGGRGPAVARRSGRGEDGRPPRGFACRMPRRKGATRHTTLRHVISTSKPAPAVPGSFRFGWRGFSGSRKSNRHKMLREPIKQRGSWGLVCRRRHAKIGVLIGSFSTFCARPTRGATMTRAVRWTLTTLGITLLAATASFGTSGVVGSASR